MDPYDDIKKFEKTMKEMIEGLFGGGRVEIFTPFRAQKGMEFGDVREPLTDINETKDEVVVTMELPGASKNDIDLSATQTSLDIKAKIKKAVNEKGVSSTSTRTFEKYLTLPEEVDPKSIKARYKNGILEVSMKKTQKPKGTKIKVE